MRKAFITTIYLSCACTLQAQDEVLTNKTLTAAELPLVSEISESPTRVDTLALPSLDLRGQTAYYPYTGRLGWTDWDLHEGLNGSLSASATVGLGRHSVSGFSQSVSLMYAVPMSPRMALAIGGYYSHFNLGSRDFNDAGVSAVLGYRFDEHWEGYVFAEKSLIKPKMPPLLYDISGLGDKIGAAVRYNFSPSLSVGISVWRQSVPSEY